MNEENKNTTKPDDKKETTSELKEFDFNGVKLYAKSSEEFEKAKELQKNLHKGYNELKAEKEKKEQEAADAARRAKALEDAKNGLWEEAEKKFSEKYLNDLKAKEETVNKLQSKVIEGELIKSLAAKKDIAPETHSMIIKLLKAEHSFEYDGEVLKSNGKPLNDVIDTFLKDKDVFKIHKSPAGSGAGNGKNKPMAITTEENKVNKAALWDAVGDAFNKNKKK